MQALEKLKVIKKMLDNNLRRTSYDLLPLIMEVINILEVKEEEKPITIEEENNINVIENESEVNIQQEEIQSKLEEKKNRRKSKKISKEHRN